MTDVTDAAATTLVTAILDRLAIIEHRLAVQESLTDRLLRAMTPPAESDDE